MPRIAFCSQDEKELVVEASILGFALGSTKSEDVAAAAVDDAETGGADPNGGSDGAVEEGAGAVGGGVKIGSIGVAGASTRSG